MPTRASLALLVAVLAASLAAIPTISRLERGGSVLGTVQVTRAFSPNGDGLVDSASLRITPPEPHEVSVTVRKGGDLVSTVVSRVPVRDELVVQWPDPRDNVKQDIAEGEYRFVVTLHDIDRTITLTTPTVVDVTPPALTDVTASRVTGRRDGLVHVTVTGTDVADLRIETADASVEPLRVARRDFRKRALGRGRMLVSVRLPADARHLTVVASDVAGNIARKNAAIAQR